MQTERIEDNIIYARAKSGTYPFKLDVCLYIADGVLIDAGSANILKETRTLLGNEKIICAALTHVHEDHTGAAAWIKKNIKVPVYLHRNSIAEASVKSDIPLYRRLTWGNREGFEADAMPLFIETEKHRFDVIDAPGHHRDHVVFHEKNSGWLFTGDLFVSRRQAVAFKDENINDAITSITKILRLDFETLFCGHSGIHHGGRKKLKAKLDFFTEFREQVCMFRKKGFPDEEINKKLFPGKNLWEFVSRGEWSSINMIRTV